MYERVTTIVSEFADVLTFMIAVSLVLTVVDWFIDHVSRVWRDDDGR